MNGDLGCVSTSQRLHSRVSKSLRLAKRLHIVKHVRCEVGCRHREGVHPAWQDLKIKTCWTGAYVGVAYQVATNFDCVVSCHHLIVRSSTNRWSVLIWEKSVSRAEDTAPIV